MQVLSLAQEHPLFLIGIQKFIPQPAFIAGQTHRHILSLNQVYSEKELAATKFHF